MAWGFMEIPPFLSIFAWLTHLFGDGIFWIKFWPDLFGVLTFIITAKIIQSLGGKAFAIFLGFLPFVFGVYLRLFFLFQPYPPEVFFWTMIAYSIILYIQTGKNKWLYILGISIGLGMVSKYSVSLFTLSILAGLLLTSQRRIFLNKHLYYAGLVALAMRRADRRWVASSGCCHTPCPRVLLRCRALRSNVRRLHRAEATSVSG